MDTLTKSIIKKIIQPRSATSHKGDHGYALLLAGNTGRMGAAVIASKACLRSGVGLLTVNVPATERFIVQTTIPEAMLVFRETTELNIHHFSAAGIGPGIGTDEDTQQLLSNFITRFEKPLLLDADALNIIAEHKALRAQIPAGTIFTPHPKEFDRLFGIHKSTEERTKTAIKMAKEMDIILVLKGQHTLITYAGESYTNTTGNAGLAKGGSGDALTGIITAFLAQGYLPFQAAQAGVYLHGLAADLACKDQSAESMLITDVIEYLGPAFKEIAG